MAGREAPARADRAPRVSAAHRRDPDFALAAAHAPVLRFDVREPFLPVAAGYRVFRASGPSPSFPRRVELAGAGRPPAALAVEYAIWWDWDIQHLYELEHVWVYVGPDGRLVGAEASWHGVFHDMARPGGALPTEAEGGRERLVLYSQPGKHAFAPSAAWFEPEREQTLWQTGRGAGTGGVCVTPLFAGRLAGTTPLADRLVHTYLGRRAFVPAFDFSLRFPLAPALLVPWPQLEAWIPRRVAWWLRRLEREIPFARRRPLRIAHPSPGASGGLAAVLRGAAETGADMVELVVEADAGNTAGVPGGGTALALAAALAAAREARVGLMLLTNEGAAPAAASAVAAGGLARYVVLVTPHAEPIAALKAGCPGLRVAWRLRQEEPGLPEPARARAAGADYLYLSPRDLRAVPSGEWVAACHRAGLGVLACAGAERGVLAALHGLGTEGVCTAFWSERAAGGGSPA